MTSMTSPCQFYKHNITHVRQRYNWDCGIACVLMLLSEEQRNEVLGRLTRICLEEGFRQNTWTIDLCYLLKRFNIKHCLYTSSQTANSNAQSNAECARVCNRFRDASNNGITVLNGTLCTKNLVSHVITTAPAILLVDAALLSCDWCKYNKLNSEFRRIFGGSYRGHYILIVGWSAGKVLYCDPARSNSLCVTTLKRLHAARMAPATDSDVILLHKDLYIQ